MFRRIELIEKRDKPFEGRLEFKHGLVGVSYHKGALEVIDAWVDIPLPKSSRHLNKNCKFYFGKNMEVQSKKNP